MWQEHVRSTLLATFQVYSTLHLLNPNSQSIPPPLPFPCCYCCSVPKSYPTLCNPMDCSTPWFPALHHLRSLLKLMSIELVMLPNHLILCCPLLLLTSIFPSIRVFSKESALHIRWPKYWSFSFNLSPSNEHRDIQILDSSTLCFTM